MNSTIIPCLRYRNAPAAIEWLCSTFGFEKKMAVPNPDGTIAHAELTFAGGMIMLGSHLDTPFGKQMKMPDEVGGFQTQSNYVIVADPDALYARAKAIGAQIVMELTNMDYGSRDFSCKDPEGHLWNFGTYDPWKPHQ